MGIQSINRAIAVLNLFKDNRKEMSLAEISESLGLVKTTVHTILKTLAQNGFLSQDAHSKRYSLGFVLFELGMRQADNLKINRNGTNPLHQLANDTGSSCRLAIWDMNTVFITLVVHPLGIDTYSRELGPRLPGYCTSLGKAILSQMSEGDVKAYLDATELISYTAHTFTDQKKLLKDLKETQIRGYAISDREILLHQVGIGAPIFNEAGICVGATSIQLNPEDISPEYIENMSSRLLRTSYQISNNMGYTPISISPQQS